MIHRERAYQRVTLEPLNFSGAVSFSSALSFDVTHETYRKCFWRDARVETDGGRMLLQARTALSGQEAFAAARLSLPAEVSARTEEKTAVLSSCLPLTQGKETLVDKQAVILYNGEEGETLWQSGLRVLADSEQVTLDEALAAHVRISAAPPNSRASAFAASSWPRPITAAACATTSARRA